MVEKKPYDITASEIFALFEDHLEGASDRPFLVLSHAMLQPTAKDAIEKSLDALGFGPEVCTFATLGDAIDDQALFSLVEGLDPVHVIVTDDAAGTSVNDAYRMALAPNAPNRIFGRQSVVFENLEALIEDEPGKRKAWELFKQL